MSNFLLVPKLCLGILKREALASGGEAELQGKGISKLERGNQGKAVEIAKSKKLSNISMCDGF